jgi:enoyl-CoA hydratase/carnithine racemase
VINFLKELPATLFAELQGEICVLFLNRPEKRNAVDLSVIQGLKLFFAQLDTSAVKGVVIAGRGDHFCSGLDLNELREYDAEEGTLHSLAHHEAFRTIQYSPVPVVCVMHGATIGAGLEIASATHLRVAERSAYYGLPEGQRGIFVGGGGSVRITRLVGVSRVIDMMMTGRTYTAEDGYQFGISQYLVESGEGLGRAVEIARRAATNSALSNFAMIQALPRIAEMSPEEGLFTEALMSGIAQSSRDAKKRLADFLEKRTTKVLRS